jgi:hypothetical protein
MAAGGDPGLARAAMRALRAAAVPADGGGDGASRADALELLIFACAGRRGGQEVDRAAQSALGQAGAVPLLVRAPDGGLDHAMPAL